MNNPAFDREYFESAYRDYRAQNPPRKLDHYVSVMRRHLPSGNVDLLDIGCGLGAFAQRAAGEAGWSVVAVDVDPDVIAHNANRYPAVEFRVGSATDPGMPQAAVDAVTAWDVIEHVPDRDEARRAIRAVLRPGGLMFMVVPTYDGMTGPIISRLDRDPTHVHRLGRGEWLSWVAADFEVVSWHGLFRYLLPGGSYVHLPTRRLRSHAPAILVVARAAD